MRSKERNLVYSFSVTDINSEVTYCNLSSFSSFTYIVAEFLEEQIKGYIFLQLASKLRFHRLWRVCLCTFSLSTAMFAVQAILVDGKSYELADGFVSCKLQDQLPERLSEVGSW